MTAVRSPPIRWSAIWRRRRRPAPIRYPRWRAADPVSQAGNLRKVEAFGHVVIHTPTDNATGDKGVYLPPTGRARLSGNVHIIHGPNMLAGSDALINTKTGVATLLAGHGGQVAGTIIPNNAPAAPK